MKKFFCAVVMAAIGLSATFAFSFVETCDALKDDRFIIKAGMGFGAMGISADGGSGTLSGLSVPVNVDMLFFKIPLGIVAEFTPTLGKVNGSSDIKGSSYAFLGGASWHINTGVKKLDVYANVKMGFRINTMKIKWNVPYASGSDSSYEAKYHGGNFVFASNLGATYYFTDLIGVNVELGYPTIISASAAIKF